METQQFQLEQLVLLSCSAGASGLQMHAHDVLTRFPACRTAVVFDSLAGVAENNVDSKLLRQYGVCSTNILDWAPELQEDCTNGVLSLSSVTYKLIGAFPQVQFVGINSKKGK